MPERRRLEDRVAALERRLDASVQDKASAGESGRQNSTSPDSAALAERIDDLEATIADLEAGLEALRGYVGSIDHVNESVERRADAALAAVERLEAAPKTPPPIATASTNTGDETETDPSETDSETTGSDSDPGLLDRVKNLR